MSELIIFYAKREPTAWTHQSINYRHHISVTVSTYTCITCRLGHASELPFQLMHKHLANYTLPSEIITEH